MLDYETYSGADLKKVGASEYSRHHSTEILCIGYRVGTRQELPTAPTRVFDPKESSPYFGEFCSALQNPEIRLVAHNALFEQWITLNVFAKRLMYSWTHLQKIPVRRWYCTAALARSVGLPGALEDVCQALALEHQKDMAGHRLMLKLAKPRKPSKDDPSTRHRDPEDLAKLRDYCAKDIEAEVELFLKLPPLHPREREFWILDQKINRRGFAVDRPLVLGALDLIAKETARLDYSLNSATDGEVKSARQNVAMIKYLSKHHNVHMPDMKAGTVRDMLASDSLGSGASEILGIRAQAARSSTSKWTAFELRSRHDGRARDNTLFNGAHTGRQSGTGLQPQNLFKTVLPQRDVEEALPWIQAKDACLIGAFFPKPMDLYASALRSAIVARPGHVIDVGDFSTVEVRVLFWLAEHHEGLKALADGKELYLDMAAEIYGISLPKLEVEYRAGDQQAKFKRQLGKQTVLGAGFGIGVNGEKFQATCKQYSIDISLSLAQKAIKAYRDKHRPIPLFWGKIENAAKNAMHSPDEEFDCGRLVWCFEKARNVLTVRLPIGRKITYQSPKLEMKRTLYGESVQLTYKGVEPVSKKFIRLSTWGGKLTENVVQAVARDLLFEALYRLEADGKSVPVLPVHDEIVAERKCQDLEVDLAGHIRFLELMQENPDWADGLPTKVEGWSADRYRK